MSAALQLPDLWAAAANSACCHVVVSNEGPKAEPETGKNPAARTKPVVTLAFYRKHTESILRRYLYASMLVGRAPSILDHPVARGWASSRPVRTFEEAVNFVLDVERCLSKLGALDRLLLSRIVLQEYTVGEASLMIGININTAAVRLSQAVDKLTEILLQADLLFLPN